ncbi:MAG TPA: cob(I)yrinic acid a,c-diamide adenosyltransferase [Promineifilum sp.]|nr:cob(I)yrinic acid a,c-diamide adenosyltransferase [Promineifilum sp.]
MPRLTKIYTRGGDAGQTSLSGGQRVAKNSLRVAAYGTVDELNSYLGVALAAGLTPRLAGVVAEIQNELFHLGSDLSFLEADKADRPLPQIEPRHVARLEALIDALTEIVGPLQNFILPGGAPTSAHLHVARAVCRRAERDVIALAREEAVGAQVMPYLNRLSDALFVMARYENHARGIAEPLWDSHA